MNDNYLKVRFIIFGDQLLMQVVEQGIGWYGFEYFSKKYKVTLAATGGPTLTFSSVKDNAIKISLRGGLLAYNYRTAAILGTNSELVEIQRRVILALEEFGKILDTRKSVTPDFSTIDSPTIIEINPDKP
jgi:hypothetical protein